MGGAVVQRHTKSDLLRPDESHLVRPDAFGGVRLRASDLVGGAVVQRHTQSDLVRPDASGRVRTRSSVRPCVRPSEKKPFRREFFKY